MKIPAWDVLRAKELLAEGKTDREIAEAVGITLSTFRSWRQRAGLPANRAPRMPQAPSEGQGVPEPIPAPEPATPGQEPNGMGALNQEPVEVSLSYNDSPVTLSAPDLAGAIRVNKYLQQLLSDLEGTLTP